MKISRKLALGATATAAVALLGGGIAHAATTAAPTVPTAASTSVDNENATGPDTDTVNDQQGDQAEGPDSAAATAAVAEQPGAPETGAASDGPGGHQDPAGSVDHQFEGQE